MLYYYKEKLKGLVQKNIETIDEKYLTRDAIIITELVYHSINKLPWFFRIPIKLLVLFIGIIETSCRGLSKISSSTKDQNYSYSLTKIIPLSGTVNKLIRSLTFLQAFDQIPSSSRNNNLRT